MEPAEFPSNYCEEWNEERERENATPVESWCEEVCWGEAEDEGRRRRREEGYLDTPLGVCVQAHKLISAVGHLRWSRAYHLPLGYRARNKRYLQPVVHHEGSVNIPRAADICTSRAES